MWRKSCDDIKPKQTPGKLYRIHSAIGNWPLYDKAHTVKYSVAPKRIDELKNHDCFLLLETKLIGSQYEMKMLYNNKVYYIYDSIFSDDIKPIEVSECDCKNI